MCYRQAGNIFNNVCTFGNILPRYSAEASVLTSHQVPSIRIGTEF